MSNANISHLGNLNPVELELTGDYPVAKETGFQLPPKGEYTVSAPPNFSDEAFGSTKGGDLSVQIDPTIVAGPDGTSTGEGTVIKFTKVSAKSFPRGKKMASQLGDYLAACGYHGEIKSIDDAIVAVESTAGVNYKVKLDWRAYNKRTGSSWEGMEKFPKRADGTYQSFLIDPAEVGKVDDQGRQLVVFANLTIPFGGYVPAEGN